MNAVLLRFEAKDHQRLPWPARVESDGLVTAGRPDAERLLGFQRDLAVQQVDVTFDDALAATPPGSNAIGMHPVYFGDLGQPGVNDSRRGIFVVDDRLRDIQIVERDR